MRNPWLDVSGADGDWRHPDDAALVLQPVSMPPQPWLGSFDRGRVCWLLGGFGTGDGMAYDHPEFRPLIDAWARRNLAGDEPNLWLDPDPRYAMLSATRDVMWWLRATKALRAALPGAEEASRALLAERLFVLEAYPYPMRTNPRQRLPTHAYTAHLLALWMRSGRPIVIGRDRRGWSELVDELDAAVGSGQALQVRNVQAASISARNLQDGESASSNLVRALIE